MTNLQYGDRYRIIDSAWHGGYILQEYVKVLHTNYLTWVNIDVENGVLDSQTTKSYKTLDEAKQRLEEYMYGD